jgi:hypothetical protein
MSDKLTMRALDKVERRLSVHVQTALKIEKRARSAGIAVATMMNAILDEAVCGDPWTADDEKRAREIIDANFAKREAEKIKRGLV